MTDLDDAVASLRRAHVKLRRIADGLDAAAMQLRLGALPQRLVEDAVYDLYAALDEHMADEERVLERLVCRASASVAARAQLVFCEHESQRQIVLAAVERTEEGLLATADLLSLVARLTGMVRADLELEEELFDDLTRAAPTRGAHHSR